MFIKNGKDSPRLITEPTPTERQEAGWRGTGVDNAWGDPGNADRLRNFATNGNANNSSDPGGKT